MSTLCPACTLATVTIARQAVSPTIGRPAASSNDICGGLAATAVTGEMAYSTYEPVGATAITACPTFQGPPGSATASMTPARSLPGISRAPGAAPAIFFQSTGFTDTARTLIRTSPGRGCGLGTDWIWTCPSTAITARMLPAAAATVAANAAGIGGNATVAARQRTIRYLTSRLRLGQSVTVAQRVWRGREQAAHNTPRR